MEKCKSSTNEWLDVDGRGGYISSTVSGPRTRRYHNLLSTALTPPTGRYILVNDVDVVIYTQEESFPISSQQYKGTEYAPVEFLDSFEHMPWPRWIFALPDGTKIQQELCMLHGKSITIIKWKVLESTGPVRIVVKPFLSGRDHHELLKKDESKTVTADVKKNLVQFNFSDESPGVSILHNGEFMQSLHWYDNFYYQEEECRGQDCHEDLLCPGDISFDDNDDAICILASDEFKDDIYTNKTPFDLADEFQQQEFQRRTSLGSPLHMAADAYIVDRGNRKSIIAGYPWFTDWGRDTFIAVRGLCLSTNRLEDAKEIFVSWAEHISEGMLPNRFTDEIDTQEFNAVDATLWYVIALYEFIDQCQKQDFSVTRYEQELLLQTIKSIADAYMHGARYGIKMDNDGLLFAGEDGQQLTWMDAKVGDLVVTPRRGKPVEVQALWINVLWILSQFDMSYTDDFVRASESFTTKFWNEETQCLFDIIDVDGTPGLTDASIRPNQIFAIGGLPISLITTDDAHKIVDVVERELCTPMGLRSLSANDEKYHKEYNGDLFQRDSAYHQGTVWPWLSGAFIEAWIRVRGSSEKAKADAQKKFINPLLAHMNVAGIGHISEIADGNEPHTPRGCPFQAWSIAEMLRIQKVFHTKE